MKWGRTKIKFPECSMCAACVQRKFGNYGEYELRYDVLYCRKTHLKCSGSTCPIERSTGIVYFVSEGTRIKAGPFSLALTGELGFPLEKVTNNFAALNTWVSNGGNSSSS